MKPSIAVTQKDRLELSTIEDNIRQRVLSGMILDPEIYNLLVQHFTISHPDVMHDPSELSAVATDEPKKRGRKPMKQKIKEMMSTIKDPLKCMQMELKFTIPQEYAQTLNENSCRVSSSSKQQDRGSEFDSMITECKTRNQRNKIQELQQA